jgi:hypothetical protein
MFADAASRAKRIDLDIPHTARSMTRIDCSRSS